MAALAPRGWLVQFLRLVPAPLHRALDAWSYRVACRKLEQRRLAGAPPPAGGIDDKAGF
jgi:hypothetical protein